MTPIKKIFFMMLSVFLIIILTIQTYPHRSSTLITTDLLKNPHDFKSKSCGKDYATGGARSPITCGWHVAWSFSK